MPFYAVRRGRNPGVYLSWDECKEQVDKFVKARYKKFQTRTEAIAFVEEDDNPRIGSANHDTEEEIGNYAPSHTSNVPTKDCYEPNGSTSFHISAISVPDINIMTLNEVKTTLNQVNHVLVDLKSLRSSLTSRRVLLERQQTSTAGVPGANNRKTNFSGKRTQLIDGPGFTNAKRYKTSSAASAICTGGTVTVYTDGACFNNGKNGAKAGIGVYWGPSDPMNVAERLTGRQTNNRAEIHAAVRAIEQAKRRGANHVNLHTDSKFMINSMTKWLKGWKRNGWILTTGKPVVNREDFEELEEVARGVHVEWIHVPGHAGIPGNEAADSLANEGAKKPYPV